MMFFTIILVLLILLILISVMSPLIYMALKLVTREHYNEHCLILPSFLTIVLWSLSYVVIVNAISSVTKLTMFEAVSASLFNTVNLRQHIPSLIFPVIVIVIVTLLLQALVLLTVNIDYPAVYNKLRYNINRKNKQNKDSISHSEQYDEMICGQNIPETIETGMQEVQEKYKLNYINSFVSSLFIFSLLFFLGILFLWVGSSIGRNMI